MDREKEFQTLLKEIEVYRSHGLFAEALGKCRELAEGIRQSEQVKAKEKLLTALSQKIRELEDEAREFEEAREPAQLSAAEMNLMEKLFSLSSEQETDTAALEGATSLLVLGQFEKALSEFSELIREDSLRVVAAKNILRCHVGLSALDNAVTQYHQWLASGKFDSRQLEKIRSLLQDILEQKGVVKDLPKPEVRSDIKEDEAEDEEFIDISAIEILLHDEARVKESIKFYVSFQIGNMISVIVPRELCALNDNLRVGMKLDDVKFYSSVINFTDWCVVSAKEQITSGPRKGDYTLLLEVKNL